MRSRPYLWGNMKDYIIRKQDDEWLAISPSGAETGPFETHEEALDEISRDALEEGGECRLMYDDGSGELEEIPNWSPESYIAAGEDEPHSGRRRVRRSRQNMRKSRGNSSRSRKRRRTHRGGSFDANAFMNSAENVKENLSQLFFFREQPDEI